MFDNDRDIALMARIREGDMVAFEALFEAYKKPLAAFFRHLCWDHQKTQDYVQEVFFRVWKSAGSYRATGRFSTYLFQIAKNLWINERAKSGRRPQPVPLDGDEDGPSMDVEDESPAPDHGLLDRELGRQIRQAVSKLDPKQQIVFVLCHYMNMKYAQIALHLDIPEGTVKSRMSAAMSTLRERLKGYLK